MTTAKAPTEREPTQQVAFRLPVSLLGRVDAYAVDLGRRTPGLTPTRADAVRALLTQALETLQSDPPPRTRQAKTR